MKTAYTQYSIAGTVALLLMSGCSTTGIKQENAELKQQMQHEAQLRQDYADKLKSTQDASEQGKAQIRKELATLRRGLNNAL